MIRDITLSLARSLADRLVRIMPPSRSEWAKGMKNEIEAIERPSAALIFALGCARVSYLARLRTLPGALAAARTSVGVATVAFSALALLSAHAFTSLAAPGGLPQIVGGLGVAFLIAGLALLRRGPVALMIIATTMLALNTLGLWANAGMPGVYTDIHQALIVEGYLLWSLLLLFGLTLRECERSPRLANFAERHGWAG